MQQHSSCTCRFMKRDIFSHLCSFREYIFAFFSCIRWDFSEFAALWSMCSGCSPSSLRINKERVFLRGCCRSCRWEATGPVSLIFTGRGEKWAQTSFLWTDTSEQTDKFLHCGAERQEESGRSCSSCREHRRLQLPCRGCLITPGTGGTPRLVRPNWTRISVTENQSSHEAGLHK